MTDTQTSGIKRKVTTPPEGYVCKLCDATDHWIQQCPLKKKRKKQKKSNHVRQRGRQGICLLLFLSKEFPLDCSSLEHASEAFSLSLICMSNRI